MDLIRSMEKSGFERGAALQVAVALAKNPHLDTITNLTVAGSLQAYIAATNEGLDVAVADLVKYVEQPARHASTVNERFGILRPEVEALISEKFYAGNQVAAKRLMEEALLQRFNPSLAAKIFVPRLSPAVCYDTLDQLDQPSAARGKPALVDTMAAFKSSPSGAVGSSKRPHRKGAATAATRKRAATAAKQRALQPARKAAEPAATKAAPRRGRKA
jgi:hypothetical protein